MPAVQILNFLQAYTSRIAAGADVVNIPDTTVIAFHIYMENEFRFV